MVAPGYGYGIVAMAGHNPDVYASVDRQQVTLSACVSRSQHGVRLSGPQCSAALVVHSFSHQGHCTLLDLVVFTWTYTACLLQGTAVRHTLSAIPQGSVLGPSCFCCTFPSCFQNV